MMPGLLAVADVFLQDAFLQDVTRFSVCTQSDATLQLQS
jgi:hypothetical protein